MGGGPTMELINPASARAHIDLVLAKYDRGAIHVPEREQEQLLLEALALAGVQLDDRDRGTVRWLAGWDCDAVLPVVKWLRQAVAR